MITDPLAIPDAIERYFKNQGLKLKAKESYRGYDYYLGEGGPIYDAKDKKVAASATDHDKEPGTLHPEDAWMREGYYIAAWCLEKESDKGALPLCGSSVFFKFNHDIQWGKDERAKARINAARAQAKSWIDNMIYAKFLQRGLVYAPANVVKELPSG